MRQLLYVSNTSRDTSDQVLEAILATSRKNNSRDGITGILLFIEGGFLQVLEGEEAAVSAAFERIRKDGRHWNSMVLLDRQAPRVFADWSMGFTRVSQGADPAGVFALTADALKGKVSPDAPAVIVTLLQTFYRINTSSSAG